MKEGHNRPSFMINFCAMTQTNPFPETAPDFSDPLGLLRACHQRMLDHCERLLKLADHLQRHGADDEALKAAAAIYRYFTTSARHHHADEEQDLFPRLARESLKLADLVHRLKQEHGELDALWRELEPLLLRPATIADPLAFHELCSRFAVAYRGHIHTENSELLEMARHILSQAELKKLGASMAERRGVRIGYL
ncbi:MAG TPA: hemerythrin domain-containing protein [Gammaproteobacteria bacterium]